MGFRVFVALICVGLLNAAMIVRSVQLHDPILGVLSGLGTGVCIGCLFALAVHGRLQ